ncbi:MAG TPA: methyltransferase domain-containing protein [Stellaceae bacterium]|nr:methyltransferase domain-containing protein [Stellaceae bacterium]
MKSAAEFHQDMVTYWGGPGGARWVDESARTEIMLSRVADLLYAAAKPQPGETVLDVGCGLGPTTIALARRVAPNGRAVGLDVSNQMIGLARQRAAGIANIEFIADDAVRHPFAAPFADLLFSRFGVMFFGDPTAAFTNLRRAVKPKGRVTFACWRKLSENPWMLTPLMAAYEHLPRLPSAAPEEPGPFSFADQTRVTRILTEAGFAAPAFTPAELAFDVAGGAGMDAAVHQTMTIGAASRALQDQPDTVRAAVAQSIRTALAPYAKGQSVELPGAIWIVESTPI